jgi:hypothetical protein
MEKKPNVLFVVFEGLAETVIDAQVLVHVRELALAGIASFEVWVLAWNDAMYQSSLARLADAERLASCKIRLFRGMRPASLQSVKINSLVLTEAATALDVSFSHVHARTDYAVQPCVGLARAIGAELIFDCRGDAAAEVDYRADFGRWKRLFRPIYREVYRHRLKVAARRCDRALFVSTCLRALVAEEIGNKPAFIVPSCASERDFFYDARLRKEFRSNLGYGNNHVVYVYSGGTQPYQRFDDMVSAFRKVAETEVNARLLIATPNIALAESAVRGLLPEGSWQVIAVPFAQVNGVLNAADVAFLLRHDTPTNRAASPTKFAEYCLVGLPVVMTNAVIDSWNFAKRLGNCVEYNERDGSIGSKPVFDRGAMAGEYRSCLGKSAFLDLYRKVYSFD